MRLTARAVMSQNAGLLAKLRVLRPAGPRGVRREPSEPVYADPVEYAREKLKVRLMRVQEEILRALLVPPCVVNVPSGNNFGKTWLAAVAISWWLDSFPAGVVYALGPRREHVVNVLWGQLRLLRQGIPTPWVGPKAPEIYYGPDHFAIGMTASRGESFRGRHIGRKLFWLDEATSPEMAPYIDELPTMLDPEAGDAAAFTYNPTDTTSRMYLEDQKSQVSDADTRPSHRFRLNCLEHENVASQLAGGPILFPHAVNVAMIDQWVRDECEPVAAGDRRATDVEWRPGSGNWFRPGPWFQARCLGLWPDAGAGVWSDALWEACQGKGGPPEFNLREIPQLGLDCATGKGDDYHGLYGRWGKVCLLGETANTMEPAAVCKRVRLACERLAGLYNARLPATAARLDPKRVPVKVDDDGVGCAVMSFLRAEGYAVIPVGAATKAVRDDLYPRKRDELWFEVAGKAKDGLITLLPTGLIAGFGLDRPTLRRLKQQLMAPEWWLVGKRRQVEPKDDTKEKIGRSPDEADALNLCMYESILNVAQQVMPLDRPRPDRPYRDRGGRPR